MIALVSLGTGLELLGALLVAGLIFTGVVVAEMRRPLTAAEKRAAADRMRNR